MIGHPFGGLLVMAVALSPASALAYSTASAFREGCHETIVSGALLKHDAWPAGTPELPEGQRVRDLAEYLLDTYGIDGRSLDDTRRFVWMSLIVGVRDPDGEGYSVADLEHARAHRLDPRDETQHAHALRASVDDGPEGDANALEGVRQALRAELQAVARAYAHAPREQNESVFIYLDFYGRVSIPVWGPAFRLGRALHVLQDSFSHCIRSDEYELRRVVAVLNLVDPTFGDYDETRDGLPHSRSLDDCSQSEELQRAAMAATVDLLSLSAALRRGQASEEISSFFGRWLQLQPSCSRTNGFCGNERWVELATQDTAANPVSCQLTLAGRRRPPNGLWGWLLLAAAMARAPKFRARRRTWPRE
ncbi:MAG: hypothetical protein OEZ06_07465 [Myxococcales bacterium]|nr:hypothetical protein [Myxococcales bacterium]